MLKIKHIHPIKYISIIILFLIIVFFPAIPARADCFTPPKSIELTDAEVEKIAQLVECEVGADTYEAKVAVAQCYFNCMDIFGLTVDEAWEKLKAGTYKREITNESHDAVIGVFYYNERVTDEPIMVWYNANTVRSDWHESQIYVGNFGIHRFFALKGV